MARMEQRQQGSLTNTLCPDSPEAISGEYVYLGAFSQFITINHNVHIDLMLLITNMLQLHLFISQGMPGLIPRPTLTRRTGRGLRSSGLRPHGAAISLSPHS